MSAACKRWFSILAVVLAVLLLHAPCAAAEEEIVADSASSAAPVDDSPIVESPITDSDRDHWAFQPITRPKLPSVQQSERERSAIDTFIAARLAKKGLTLAPDADRPTLLRRLSLDLTGLPPTADELAAFVADESPDAYERQVDRLLASPAYGERWGQHWLDLARFADTDGFEHDKIRPEAWRYRDWVIKALNADLPYDQFVTQQLAGDMEQTGDSESEIRDPKSALPDAAVPTMFTLAGPDMPDVNDQAERRHNLMNELTSTVGSVLLGLQLGCAQCHDHKYDPISQADFYRLRAVFEPAVPELKRDKPASVLAARSKSPTARLWIRGDHRRPGAEVPPGFPRIASDANESAAASSSGEPPQNVRLQFAAWLFRDSNPLTARVMANRVWQHHFGRGIFDTPSDVGLVNTGPTHPELLDWLAAELRDGGWSVKRLHREILCSTTYRQASRSSGADAAEWARRLEVDSGNGLYSRFPRRRLDGETIRDAMLSSAGLLSTEQGGRGVMPPLPDELTITLLKGQWSPSKREADHYKRSIYLFARRNLRYPLFEAFDRPDANASCPVRSVSTTAPQSLVLLNGDLTLLAAQHLAGRVSRETTDPAERLRRIYLHVFSRAPSESDLSRLQAFVDAQRQSLASERRPADQLALPVGGLESDDPYEAAALVDVCLAVFNANEFVYLE